MINTYTLPTQPLQTFDTTVLTERLHMMVALTLTLLDIEWMDARGVIKSKRLQRRCMKRVSALTSRVRRVAAAILKVKTHNALLEMKLEMLGNPAWRARVLKDLGGMAKLKLWDAAWLRQLEPPLEDAPMTRGPEKPEPIWWRSPERVAESERLKARFRLCEKACVNPRTLKDPFKVDFEGEFRLAPIPRTAYAKGLPRIYSKVDICEYGFDAMPIWKDFGIGVSCVYPMEFYAVMILEQEDEDTASEPTISESTTSKHTALSMFPCVVDFAAQIPRGTGSDEKDPGSAASGLGREQSLYMSANDNDAFIEFIGRKNYKYIFYDPG